MAGREKKTMAEIDADFAAAEAEERLPAPVEPDETQYVVASAKSIPRPGTSLASPPKGSIGNAKVSLLAELEDVPVLEEVQKINKESTGDARTPLMTVVHAILAKHWWDYDINGVGRTSGQILEQTVSFKPIQY